MLFNDLRLSLCKKFFKRLKFAAYYDGFAMLAKEKRFIGKCSSKLLAVLALPAGTAFYLMLKLKK